jgi:hypothetical protein
MAIPTDFRTPSTCKARDQWNETVRKTNLRWCRSFLDKELSFFTIELQHAIPNETKTISSKNWNLFDLLANLHARRNNFQGRLLTFDNFEKLHDICRRKEIYRG